MFRAGVSLHTMQLCAGRAHITTTEGYAYQRAATYVDRILKGVKPGDLPVQQPALFEMFINRKSAKALALTIRQSLLIIADKIIECVARTSRFWTDQRRSAGGPNGRPPVISI